MNIATLAPSAARVSPVYMPASLPIIHRRDDITWQRFSVAHEYPVSFTENLFCPRNRTLVDTLSLRETNKCHRVSLFIDQGVIDACPSLLSDVDNYFATFDAHMVLVAKPMTLPAGEAIKQTRRPLLNLQRAVAEQHLDRHSYIIGIGGGALLDAVGLVAATSHRGIRHIRIPTTVLGQNDSGIGVKNGINLFGQKNYLGTFAPPFAVLNDYRFIESLPAREKISGMAEAVKVALIRDKEFFTWLERNAEALARFDKGPMQIMIRRCAELHMQQIANGGDPFETGSARPLDFGHWAAHRLETMTRHELRHGEAVAIGLALDTRYSVLSGLLDDGADSRVCRLLEILGFTLWHRALATETVDQQLSVLQGLSDFKEHLGGELTITLLEELGHGIEVHSMNLDLVRQAVDWLGQRHAAIERSSQHPQVKATADRAQNLDIDAVAEHLATWLFERLDAANRRWLEDRLRRMRSDYSERDLHITLGLLPRKLGRTDLNLMQSQIVDAQLACGRRWDPSDWSVDTAARCLVLITLLQARPAEFDQLFADLCQSAELNESISLYRCTAVMPQSKSMDAVIGVGLRTHIRALFEAVAHRNPYPALNFDQHRFNHVVLKALFIDSHLWPIQGIDERSNAELATVLCDYAHERWAAHRQVTPELWRCVGPFATGSMIDDLHRALRADDEFEQQAGLLALLSSPNADHAALRSDYTELCERIDAGKISWDSIGRSESAARIAA